MDLIERLRREADISARPGQMDRLNALADEFAAALEAAREDAERLDWLAREAPTLWGSRDRGGYELPYFDITSGRECCNPGDLRAAIDQARGKGVQS